MKRARNIENMIKELRHPVESRAHDRIVERLLDALKQHQRSQSAARQSTLGRIIMKNSILKLAVAAAVVAAILIGIGVFSNSGSGVVWAEVLAKTEQIPAVVYDMTAEIGEPEEKLVVSSRTYAGGDYGTRSDTFMDGQLIYIWYRLPRKNVAYKIKVDRKQYWRFDVSYDQAALGSDPDDPRTVLKNLLSDGGYTELGRTTLDGVVVEGIEGHHIEDNGEDCVIRIWVDVEMNLPVRIEVGGKGMEGGRMQQHKLVMENFDWNAQLDESFFEPNIPDDYTQVEDPKTAQARREAREVRPLTDEERAARPEIKQTVTLFLQACGQLNWDEILKHAPGLAKLPAEQREAIDTYCSGLEILEMGEPFKTAESDIWLVPCQIKWKTRGPGSNKEIRVRYDETQGKFVIAGGF